MIKLTDNYCIGFAPMNIILYEKTNTKSKNHKLFDNHYYKAILFYGDFESLLRGLINRKIIENGENYTTLNEISTYIKNISIDISGNLKNIVEMSVGKYQNDSYE